MSERQANAQPCFRPETMKGRLAGRRTYQNSLHPLAPPLRPAWLKILGISLRPSSIANVTDSREPMTTTNRLALWLSANHNNARGHQQILAKLWRLTSNAPTVASRKLLLSTSR